MPGQCAAVGSVRGYNYKAAYWRADDRIDESRRLYDVILVRQ